MDERDINERVSTLEEQVRGIAEVKSKIDILYNLLMEMKLESVSCKSDYTGRDECSAWRKEINEAVDKLNESKQKVMWGLLSTGGVFTLWLIEQVLHITLKIG